MFKIYKLTNNIYAYQNILHHNKKDFDDKNDLYLNFKDSVYRSIHNEDVQTNHVHCNGMLRIKYSLALLQEIEITPYNIQLDAKVKNLTLYINNFNKKNNITLHEDEFIAKFKSIFKNFYFHKNQSLLVDYNNTVLKIDIDNDSNGFLSNDTDIKIFNEDVINLGIVGSNLLKRDLFKDDFSFENIGIGGLDHELLNIFKRALSTRGISKDIVKKLGIKHTKGVLLYGPPGTGKTLIARNIGGLLTNDPPKIINGPEIFNKYVGQSEQNIRDIFSDAQNDTSDKLHIIIFDEIDAICKKRGSSSSSTGVGDTVVNQLLTMIEGVKELDNIFIIAMTNRKDLLDEALLRPGRLGVHVEIGLPNFEGRKQIFRIHTKNMSSNQMLDKNISFDTLAKLTENYSGAEITAVIREASAIAVHKQLSSDKKDIKCDDIVIGMDEFLAAIDFIKPKFGIRENTCDLHEDFFTQKHKTINDGILSMLQTKRLQSFIIFGENKSGKTSLLSQIQNNCQNISFLRMIRPIDVVNFDDFEKNNYLINTFKDAYLSKNSLIIIDDIEIIINYANICHTMTFSNRLYQTVLTLLKTEPENKERKLTIIVSCGQMELFEGLKNNFTENFVIN